MKYLLLFTLLVTSINVSAQQQSDTTSFEIIENPAMPKGGYPELYRYISNKLKYPKEARKKKIEGKVYVEFVISEDGSVDQQSVRALSRKYIESSTVSIMSPNEMPDSEVLNNEAVRVIKTMPDWSPPEHKGENVKQRIILPINFKL